MCRSAPDAKGLEFNLVLFGFVYFVLNFHEEGNSEGVRTYHALI